MSTNNIFQILSENKLAHLLNEHVQDLVVVMFSQKDCPPCKKFKPTFIKSASIHKTCWFAYIDLQNFKFETDKYKKKVESTPTTIFFYNNQDVITIKGANEKFDEIILNTIKRIQDIKNMEKIRQEEENANKMLHQKIYTIGKLNGLATAMGAKLDKQYNASDPLEEIIEAYYVLYKKLKIPITSPEEQIKEMSNDQPTITTIDNSAIAQIDTQEYSQKDFSNNETSKDEKIQQIKALKKLEYEIQMQRIEQLKLLKNHQKITKDKEMYEKNKQKN